MCQVPGAGTWHLNFQVPGALCKVTGKVGKWNVPGRVLRTSPDILWGRPESDSQYYGESLELRPLADQIRKVKRAVECFE